ncbi:hypothetical protein [Amycolatopsis alba]|uniref:Uncharacterized protein n=1 Tax=Amycolatopsis alba DSM 44262 TaxID=1125972 RepID=A0A229RJX0_AMYAL|nr:hypothetical protein [Amycolatopsis alba]OXM46759.1 hypothetical protein CFP75_26530 [Amycolatopsis alba DSM 44262]
MFSFQWLVGFEPWGTLTRTGTARVEQCGRSAVHIWMTYSCEAEVQWDTVSPGEEQVSRTTVTSVSALAGRVPVEEFKYRKKNSSRSGLSVVPVDRPSWPVAGGWWILLVFVSVIPGRLAGFRVGGRLGRLLPEPKEKPKDWRGVSRRITSGMNGRRRHKR